MTGIFITATGTGIGKTYVTEQLLGFDKKHLNKFIASKPIISGWSEDTKEIQQTDTGRLLQAQGRELTKEAILEISPWRFCAPLSPDMAAKKEGKRIIPESLIHYSKQKLQEASQQQKIHLIEGVGGVMVPIDGSFTVLDWIQNLKIPCIVVTGSYLGTLSHTLTAIEVLKMRGITILGVIINETPESTVSLAETYANLASLLTDIFLFALPYQQGIANEQSIYSIYSHLLASS